jgi:hypothetical protein
MAEMADYRRWCKNRALGFFFEDSIEFLEFGG